MLPVLDLSVVSALAVDLQSPGEALEVLDQFQAGLPQCIRTINHAFASMDPHQAASALADLHRRALMVGALQLHAITGNAQNHADPRVDRTGGTPVAAAGHGLVRELTREAILFTHAYLALRSNPTLLDPPRTDHLLGHHIGTESSRTLIIDFL